MTFSALLTVSMERTGRVPADDVLLLVLGFFDAEQLHNIRAARAAENIYVAFFIV